MLSFTFIVLAC